MTPSADSSEFADLVCRWLDETATADEAAQLWQCVSSCPECAREFAAAARFEALLDETVRARNVEADARQQLAVAPRLAKTDQLRKPATSAPSQPSMKWLALAAALVVLGFITAMLWPVPVPEAPKLADEKAAHEAKSTRLARESAPMISQSSAPALEAPATTTDTVPLTDRLDRFFLNSVALDQMPLSQALSLLQKQLQEADYEHTLDLTHLRIEVPTGASARRVSFRSNSIPFLKAVRAVAALAGCDVLVSEPTITLIMQNGIFPQLAEKRVLSDMLAGRLNADGTAMIDDEARLAGLWDDAMTLGIAVNEDGTAALSRGQWEALRMMSDSRDQVGRVAVPTFAVYEAPLGTAPENRALTADELAGFQRLVQQGGLQPLSFFTPTLDSPNNQDPLVLSPNGEGGNIASNDPEQEEPINRNTTPRQLSPRVIVGTWGSIEHTSATLRVTGSVMTMAASINAYSGGATSASAGAAVITTIIVPVTPPP